jgi:endonuclease/exonuclease/phosphatase (EEP) superfamily protein YafD/predicted RNA binding protein YcfA (HicA-like mRNA interferase family)
VAPAGRRYWPIWAAAIPVALWALVRAFGLESGGLAVTAMLFTPYAAIAALLIAGVAVALRNWPAAIVATLATAYLGAAILPRAMDGETARATGHETLTVLSANVYLGAADPAALIALIDRYRPDLLSIQELTPSFARALRRDDIDRRLPHSLVMTQPKGHGAGLYSRFRLTPMPQQTHFLFRMPRARLVLPNGRRLRVVAVHPQPPSMSVDRWREALESLPKADSGSPWLLVGDFNATFDQAEFRDVVDSGYRDAGYATGKGLEPTWPGPEVSPWGLITIDHILSDRRLGVAEYGVDDLSGSDHRAIHAELVLPWRCPAPQAACSSQTKTILRNTSYAAGMGQFPSIKAKRLLAVLERKPLDYRIARQAGSHRRLEAPSRPSLTFAFHDNTTIPAGLVRKILVRDVGLAEDEARKLL